MPMLCHHGVADKAFANLRAECATTPCPRPDGGLRLAEGWSAARHARSKLHATKDQCECSKWCVTLAHALQASVIVRRRLTAKDQPLRRALCRQAVQWRRSKRLHGA